eukprot:2216601-Amphidinium_carterae.1
MHGCTTPFPIFKPRSGSKWTHSVRVAVDEVVSGFIALVSEWWHPLCCEALEERLHQRYS